MTATPKWSSLSAGALEHPRTTSDAGRRSSRVSTATMADSTRAPFSEPAPPSSRSGFPSSQPYSKSQPYSNTPSGVFVASGSAIEERPRPLLDELGKQQLLLTTSLVSLAALLERLHAPRRALARVREHGRDLIELRKRLGAVLIAAQEPRFSALFAKSASLPDYVRGLYACGVAMTRTLEDATCEPGTKAGDLPENTRHRLRDALDFHLEELEPIVRRECARWRRAQAPQVRGLSDPLAPLSEHIEALFVAAGRLTRHIERL